MKKQFDTPDRRGEYAIVMATREGDARTVTGILSAGANPDVYKAGSSGIPALVVALRCGHDKIASTLLDHGASIIAGRKGETAREWAMSTDSPVCRRIRKLAEDSGKPFGGKKHREVVAPWRLGTTRPTLVPSDPAQLASWAATLERTQLHLLKLGARFSDAALGPLASPVALLHLMATAEWTAGTQFRARPRSKLAGWFDERPIELVFGAHIEKKPDADRLPEGVARWMPYQPFARAGAQLFATSLRSNNFAFSYDDEEVTDNIVFKLGPLEDIVTSLVRAPN